MKLIRLVVTVASWFALAGGLFWTGKVGTSDEAKPLPPVLEERVFGEFDQPVELVFNRAGSFPFVLGLAVRDDRDAGRVQDRWSTRTEESGQIEVRLDSAAGAEKPWVGKLNDLAIVDSLAKDSGDLLVIARGQMETRAAGKARLSLAVANLKTDSPMAALLGRLRLVLGEVREDIETYVKFDPRPGLLLLAGIAGVFSHLFMVLGRLVIPMQAAALPDDPA